MKKKIYLAAPLFNEQEIRFNKYIKSLLVTSYDVYLPQEDGALFKDLLNDGISQDNAEKIVFEYDIQAMKTCDILLAVLDGAHIDEGVAFEIGYMTALNKKCFGLQTDIRRQLPTGNNPMINKSINTWFKDIDELVTWINSSN